MSEGAVFEAVNADEYFCDSVMRFHLGFLLKGFVQRRGKLCIAFALQHLCSHLLQSQVAVLVAEPSVFLPCFVPSFPDQLGQFADWDVPVEFVMVVEAAPFGLLSPVVFGKVDDALDAAANSLDICLVYCVLLGGNASLLA